MYSNSTNNQFKTDVVPKVTWANTILKPKDYQKYYRVCNYIYIIYKERDYWNFFYAYDLYGAYKSRGYIYPYNEPAGKEFHGHYLNN